jgi:hypothetical protein
VGGVTTTVDVNVSPPFNRNASFSANGFHPTFAMGGNEPNEPARFWFIAQDGAEMFRAN